MRPISDKLFDFLVSGMSGDHFENLAKRIFSAVYGEEFTPLAGMHDGGADGLIAPRVYSGQKPATFFQFSVTDGDRAKTKVVNTIQALTKGGRAPRQLIYSTTERLPKQDILVSEVFEEHQVLISVRDVERLRQLVADNAEANRVFLEFFAPEIDNVAKGARHLDGAVNNFVSDPTVFSFLDYELRDRFSRDQLNKKILDSLIYWSLRGTDPDTKKFMTRAEIAEAISQVFPAAKSQLLPHLHDRLEELSQRDQNNSERIRHYKADDLFCLPFEMRRQLAEATVEEERLQEDFCKIISERFQATSKEKLDADTIKSGSQLIFDSVHEYFVEQGLILSAWLSQAVDKLTLSDQIVEDRVAHVLGKSKAGAKLSPTLIADCMRVLRQIFYEASELERRYLGYLSRTSLLFMTLQSAPRIIEYFNQMSGNFKLLVGTDILIKAISEQYLPEPHRQVENLLKACSALGTTLILTEPVLNEVFTHLHAVDLEYRNHYLPNQAYLTTTEISECDRILIRTYYYARILGKVRISWEKFINSLLDPSALRGKSEKGRQELRGLLTLRFRMEYMDAEELQAGIDRAGKEELAQRLIEARRYRSDKNEELSHNDALMAYAVYALRRKGKESAIYDGFGYRTWWLTKETHIMSLTGPLVAKESGIPYIMRPEFLLNFIVLSPNAAHVRETFREFLPTTVGLQIGQHLKPEAMHALLAGTKEWAELPPERVSMMISERVNKLKFDRFKQYTQKLD